MPVLVLHGDADASSPLEITGRPTADLVPGAELRVVPDAGHGLYASHATVVVEALLDFLAEHGAPGAGDGPGTRTGSFRGPPGCSE